MHSPMKVLLTSTMFFVAAYADNNPPFRNRSPPADGNHPPPDGANPLFRELASRLNNINAKIRRRLTSDPNKAVLRFKAITELSKYKKRLQDSNCHCAMGRWRVDNPGHCHLTDDRPCTCRKGALTKLKSDDLLTDAEYAQATELLTEEEKDCRKCENGTVHPVTADEAHKTQALCDADNCKWMIQRSLAAEAIECAGVELLQDLEMTYCEDCSMTGRQEIEKIPKGESFDVEELRWLRPCEGSRFVCSFGQQYSENGEKAFPPASKHTKPICGQCDNTGELMAGGHIWGKIPKRPCSCPKALSKLKTDNLLTDAEYAQATRLLSKKEKEYCTKCEDGVVQALWVLLFERVSFFEKKFNVVLERGLSDRFESALGDDLTVLILQHAMGRSEACQTLLEDETLMHLAINYAKGFGADVQQPTNLDLDIIMKLEGKCEKTTVPCYDCPLGEEVIRNETGCYRKYSNKPDPHLTRAACEASGVCLWMFTKLDPDSGKCSEMRHNSCRRAEKNEDDKCSICFAEWNFDAAACPTCERTGLTRITTGKANGPTFRWIFPCPKCNRRGSNRPDCPDCGGSNKDDDHSGCEACHGRGCDVKYRCKEATERITYCDSVCCVCNRTVAPDTAIVGCERCGFDICKYCKMHDELFRTRPCGCILDTNALVFKPGRYKTTTQLDLFKTKKGTSPNTDFLSALSLGAVEESISLLSATYVDVTETQWEKATGTTWGKTPGGWAKLYAYFSTCTDCILDDGTKIEQWMFCESCDASGRVHDTHPLKVVPLNARDGSSALGFRPGRYRLTAGLGLFKTKKDTRNTDFLSALSLGAVEESIRLTDATYIDVEETQHEATGTTWGLTPGGWAKLYDAETRQLNLATVLVDKDCSQCRGKGAVPLPYQDECAECDYCGGVRHGNMEKDAVTQLEEDERLLNKEIQYWNYHDFASFLYGFQVPDRDIKPRVTWLSHIVKLAATNSLDSDRLIEMLDGEDVYGDEHPWAMRPQLLQETLDLEDVWPPKGVQVREDFWRELYMAFVKLDKAQNPEEERYGYQQLDDEQKSLLDYITLAKCQACDGTGNTDKDPARPQPCTDGYTCEECDGTGMLDDEGEDIILTVGDICKLLKFKDVDVARQCQ